MRARLLAGLTVFSLLSSPVLAGATFHADYGENKILLSDESAPRCDQGWRRAGEFRWVLNELKMLRELCYRVNEKTGDIELKDPAKLVFGKFSLSPAKFTRIPTQEEQAEAEASRRLSVILEEIRATSAELNSRSQRQPAPAPIQPFSCIKAGSMLSCM